MVPGELTREQMFLNEAFITWYNSRYKELVASALLERWQRTDTVIQTAIAATTAGSAVAGWQLWAMPGMRMVWTSICGIASLMIVGHRVLRVVDKVKVWSEARQAFTMLKNQMETLRYEAKTSFKTTPDEIHKKYLAIRAVFEHEDKKTPDQDVWLTQSLENSVLNSIYNSIEKTSFDEELQLARGKLTNMEPHK